MPTRPINGPTGTTLRDRLIEMRAREMRSAPIEPARIKAIADAAEARQQMLIPHQQTFATLYNAGLRVFYSRFDEALRDNWQNALAMRRDPFIHNLLRHRQLPVVSLPHHIEVDDPDDPEQAACGERYGKILDATPRFQALKLYLGEDKFYGKYASQVIWDHKRISGRDAVAIMRHEPVQGDKLQFKWDGTPGVLVHAGWAPGNRVIQSHIETTDRGRALFLYDSYWRDRFIISEFEPSDSDWMFEGDQAGGVHGVGLRSRVYWAYQLRIELLSWMIDALQRIGVNGMLYGSFEAGNAEDEAAVIAALKMLIRDNVTAFPRQKGQDTPTINRIEPTEVGYDTLYQLINDYIDDIIRQCFLGQSLSSEARPTGLNSTVAELHESTFEHIIRYDATSLAETLTKDLLLPLSRMNPIIYRGKKYRGEDIPFGMRVVMSVSKNDVKEKAEVVKLAYDLGLPMDSEEVYSLLGLTPPKDDANVIKKQEPMPGQMPGQAPGQMPIGVASEPGGKPGVPTLPDAGQPAPNAPAKRFRIERKPAGGLKVGYRPGERRKQVTVPAKVA